MWAAGISLISVVCVVIKRGISETRVRGNMGNNVHVDSLPCKLLTLSHPCAELHHYCWVVLPQGSGHLGSSCILALSSANNLQEDWLSDVMFLFCFGQGRVWEAGIPVPR